MKHLKSGFIAFMAILTLVLTGCPKEPITEDEAMLSIAIEGMSNRTVFPTIQPEKLTNITLTYCKVGEEVEITQTWENWDAVESISIEIGTYYFVLSAEYCGFTYKGSVGSFSIASGDNTVAFNLKLSEINEEDMTGTGIIAHTLTFPDNDGAVKLVKAALYRFDENDELQIAYEAESVTVVENEDGTYKATYSKNVDSGEYVLKYFFYADANATLCMDEYSTVVYVLNDVISSADESTDRLCSVYSVTYELNDGYWCDGYTVPAKFSYIDKLVLPASENIKRPGYTFVKWSKTNDSEGTSITEYKEQKDIKVYAIWQANTDTAYTVKYWFQNIEDDEYTEDKSKKQALTGTTDTTTSVTAEEVTGFTAGAITQVNIDGDGRAAVNVYYDRNIYKITFVLGDASTTTTLDSDGAISGKYGATVTIADPAMDGYTFGGWLNEDNEEESLPETFTANRKFTAYFSKNVITGNTSLSIKLISEDIKITETSNSTDTITIKAEAGYSNYKWTVNGTEQNSNTNILNFNTDDSCEYRVFLTANKNGIKYSSDFIVDISTPKSDDLLTMIPVITESTIITGDQTDGVFLTGRKVTLSPYSIGKYEVTQKTYEEVMGVNPSYYNSEPADGETQELKPVENINWYMSIAFCNKLSLKKGYDICYSVKDSDGNEIDWVNLSHSSIPTSSNSYWDAAVCDMTKNGYRLPTEAEWEFAARGGNQSADDWNYTYSGSNTVDDVAWYIRNSSSKTHEVGFKNANRLGIYDMSGNVWEWCQDWYSSVSSSETVTDPTGGASGSYLVLRGGGDDYGFGACAVSSRGKDGPCYCDDSCGFRLVRSADNWKDEHNKTVAAQDSKENHLLDMVSVITESTTITGDQTDGVFPTGRIVTLSPYSIGKYPVTQKTFEDVMGRNPSYLGYDSSEISEFRPVEEVSWYKAIALCNKLSLKQDYDLCYSIKDSNGNEIDWLNLEYSDIPISNDTKWNAVVCDMSKNGYRLPTDAEWEFAARGGDQSTDDWNYTYSGSDIFDDVGWMISGFISHEVGLKKANRLGLYDMSGNGSEWCFDLYGSISASETVIDPTGATSGVNRVHREDFGNGSSSSCSVYYRIGCSPDFAGSTFPGLRLARSADNWKEEHDKAVAAQDSKGNHLLDMVSVITESTTITGDQTDGVFLTGRTVTLSPYSIGKYEVTQKTFEEVMGTNPSSFISDPEQGEIQEFRPVDSINWYRAIAFCNKLSLKKGYDICYSVKDSDGNEIDWVNLSHSSIPTSSNSYWDAAVCDMTKNGYRLPTEAEWEFAARGGDQSADDWNYTYSGSNMVDDVAWYANNSNNKIHEVGLKKANRIGIYDMSGNLWEWCGDGFGSISSSETVIDPVAESIDSGRVLSGGSYVFESSFASVKSHYREDPYYYISSGGTYGIRLARSADNWEEEHNKALNAVN